MTKIMNASESMTDGQIEAVVNQLRDAMHKHRDKVGKEPAQQVLGIDNLGMRMFEVFRDIAEKLSGLLTRRVKVDRTLTPEQMIDATGRVRWYINPEVLSEMPSDGFDDGNVELFDLDYAPTTEELDHEYENRGLRPDPYALARAMTDDPAFADERPVVVQWRDKQNHACCAVFLRRGAKRYVAVHWGDDGWLRDYRFAGVRK